MLNVSDLLMDLDRKNDMFLTTILEAVDLALQPYGTGGAQLYLGERTDFTSFNASGIVVIECRNFPRIPFSFELKPISLDICCNMHMAYEIADEAYRWFYYRHALPADDHIILGEE